MLHNSRSVSVYLTNRHTQKHIYLFLFDLNLYFQRSFSIRFNFFWVVFFPCSFGIDPTLGYRRGRTTKPTSCWNASINWNVKKPLFWRNRTSYANKTSCWNFASLNWKKAAIRWELSFIHLFCFCKENEKPTNIILN